MNQRAVKLYQQALEFAYMSIGKEHADAAYFQGAVAGKFAELIVQECVRYFNEDYQRDFNTLWREDLSKGIKEHFGVEE